MATQLLKNEPISITYLLIVKVIMPPSRTGIPNGKVENNTNTISNFDRNFQYCSVFSWNSSRKRSRLWQLNFFLFQLSGFACFIFSLLVTCICIGLTNVMERSDFYQHYYIQLAENQSTPVDDRPLGERIIAVVKETFNIYLNFGLSVWNYILITFINFTATLCVFPAICQLASSYEYKNSKSSLFNKQIINLYK